MLRRDCLWIAGTVWLTGGCASVRPDAAVVEALAPQGKLRTAFLAGPIYATADPSTGRYRGVAVDLGEALARQLGVPFEPMPQAGVPAILAGAQAGSFDLVLMGISAERAATIEFSPPYLEVEQGVLLRPGGQLTRIDEMDRTGQRVGVLERSGADAFLSRQPGSLQIVRAANLDSLFTELAAARIDMVAATKSRLFAEAAKLPGSRVLEGRLLVEPLGMGVARSRPAAAASYVARFVEEAKASGMVAAAIARANLLGVAVPAMR